MVYPRLYKPYKYQEILCWIYIVFISGFYVNLYFNYPDFFSFRHINEKTLVMVFTLLGMTYLIYYYVIFTFKYRVILWSDDKIEVTKLFGTVLINRSNIHSYSKYYGNVPGGILLKLNNSNKKIDIRFSFEQDEEFNQWFESIDCKEYKYPRLDI